MVCNGQNFRLFQGDQGNSGEAGEPGAVVRYLIQSNKHLCEIYHIIKTPID